MNQRKILSNTCKRFLILSYSILSISCMHQDKKWIISGNSGKYWDIYRMRERNYLKARYGYYFKNNGECIYYSYSKNNINGNFKRDKFDFGDVIYTEKWSMKMDSVINILGIDYKISHLSKDKFIIVNVANNKDTIYLKLSNK